jgi:hypothetical protein
MSLDNNTMVNNQFYELIACDVQFVECNYRDYLTGPSKLHSNQINTVAVFRPTGRCRRRHGGGTSSRRSCKNLAFGFHSPDFFVRQLRLAAPQWPEAARGSPFAARRRAMRPAGFPSSRAAAALRGLDTAH